MSSGNYFSDMKKAKMIFYLRRQPNRIYIETIPCHFPGNRLSSCLEMASLISSAKPIDSMAITMNA